MFLRKGPGIDRREGLCDPQRMLKVTRANMPMVADGGWRQRKPRVLAPAGDWECVRAAVENGADAVYFGVGRFNARMRAHNFTEDDLPKLFTYLHERGVCGYVTFNTLVFPDELEAAEASLRQILNSGADAVIVQDIGMARLIKALSPEVAIHASTQMTIVNAEGVQFARELGAEVVVMARECSISELAAIRSALGPGSPALEVFVHGALCVAYSGQCLTSEALGGRSANRGECAQACRMAYDLIRDGEKIDLGDRRYLLSPRDLAGLAVLPELIEAGVETLKIEGRLKAPEYVAAITRAYREAVDAAWQQYAGGTTAAVEVLGEVHRKHRYAMEMTFSRGLHTGWLEGIDNQSLVHARFGKKRGVRLGTVEQVEAPWVVLRPESDPLKAGDGVVFDSGRPELEEEGARVHEVKTQGGNLALRFATRDLRWERLARGQIVWKTSDPELDRELRRTFSPASPSRTQALNLQVRGKAGGPLEVEAWDDLGHRARVESSVPLVAAETQSLGPVILERQLGRLGGTPFHLGELHLDLSPGLYLPVVQLNSMRRELVSVLLDSRRRPPVRALSESPVCPPVEVAKEPPITSPPELIGLARTLEQVTALLECGIRTIYSELEDPKRQRDAVRQVRAVSRTGADPARIFIAPPRIHKEADAWILEILRSAQPDGFLVRNHAHLGRFPGCELRGDFSLNVANRLTAGWLRERYGLTRLTASYDLNIRQLLSLLESLPVGTCEVTLHQYMPMFHMEHCVFCAFLTTGKDYRDCGRPCEKHRVDLRDRVGARHALIADAGCRNTVFNSKAQTGAEYVGPLTAAGAAAFRLEFLREDQPAVKRIVTRYQDLLAGRITGRELWTDLRLGNQIGVTRGTLQH